LGSAARSASPQAREAGAQGPLIEVDGAERLGRGTILRGAVAMAALLGEPLHMVRARAGSNLTPG
jgi:RNA 3'-terminal phosphate cyclase